MRRRQAPDQGEVIEIPKDTETLDIDVEAPDLEDEFPDLDSLLNTETDTNKFVINPPSNAHKSIPLLPPPAPVWISVIVVLVLEVLVLLEVLLEATTSSSNYYYY